MADIARKIALFNAAYKIARAHFSGQHDIRGLGHKLNLGIRRGIAKGITEAKTLAKEVIREIEDEN